MISEISFEINIELKEVLLRVPLHEPGLDVNPGQLTRRGKRQVLFTRARVTFVDYQLR